MRLHNNSGCDNTNYKSKQSVDQFWKKRAKYIRAYSTNRSADANTKEASYKRAYKAKKILKPKKKACESQSSVMKHYRTNSKASCIQGFIYKFHNIISQGPMLICSCCDQ